MLSLIFSPPSLLYLPSVQLSWNFECCGNVSAPARNLSLHLFSQENCSDHWPTVTLSCRLNLFLNVRWFLQASAVDSNYTDSQFYILASSKVDISLEITF